MNDRKKNRRLLPLLLVFVLTVALLPAAPAHADSAAPSEYFQSSFSENYSIIDALYLIGYSCTYQELKKIAASNSIYGYSGTADQNLAMLFLLRNGRLLRPQDFPAPVKTLSTR